MIRPKGVVLDLDGTLKRGRRPIPGAVDAVRALLGSGVMVCYLTNNSTRSTKASLTELTDIGFPEAPLISSSLATSILIRERLGRARCLVVGEEGLMEELRAGGHDPIMAGTMAKGPFDALVAGLDRSFDYGKLTEALSALREGALFMATNRDPTLPVEGGRVLPGAGSIVSAIMTASGVIPLVAGKPEPFSTGLAVERMGCLPGDVLAVGDRPEMDALAAKRAGCMAALVRTGEDRPDMEPDIPRYDDIGALVRELLG